MSPFSFRIKSLQATQSLLSATPSSGRAVDQAATQDTAPATTRPPLESSPADATLARSGRLEDGLGGGRLQQDILRTITLAKKVLSGGLDGLR